MTDLASQRRRSIMDAIRSATDEAERARLLEELERTIDHDIAAPINAAQLRVWADGEQMREILRTELGNTNEMIGGVNEHMRLLTSMFQSFGERFTDLEETVKAHDDRLMRLDSDMTESKADRQLIHQEVNEVLQQVEALAVTIGQLVERNKEVDSMLPPGADRDKMLHRLIVLLTDDGE